MTLVEIITAICARAGVPESALDTSLLQDVEVGGLLVTNQYAASQSLLALAQVYHFDAAAYDGVIHFIPRARSSVATITENDMVEDEDEVEQNKRSDSISIPRVLNLNYYDLDQGGLTTAKQTSERSGDRRNSANTSIQSPVVMSADVAAQAADIAHKIMIEESKGDFRFSLPDSFLALVPSDPIIVQWYGKSERVRIAQLDILDGFQSYICMRDRQSAYTSDVEGLPPPAPTPPISRAPGPTLLVPLDIPLLRDADDNAGMILYFAVAGVAASWTGALIELSYDGGTTYVESQSATVGAVIGELTSALEDHPWPYPDLDSEFSVRLDSYNASMTQSDLAGMLNRANLAAVGSPEDGWELINFANALEDSNGEWTLSNLLRGRKATATREHPIGAQFVLLERSFIGVDPMSVSDIGRTLTFRATSFGLSSDQGTIVELVYRGESQRERPAHNLHAYQDGDTLHVSWIGVGRLGGGSSAAHGIRFTDYIVTLSSTDGVQTFFTTDQFIDLDISGLTGQLFVSVAQRNSLTGEGPAIWWPFNPSTDENVIFLLGNPHPLLDYDARFIDRQTYPEGEFYIDIVNAGGTVFQLHKFPDDATSLSDRIGGMGLGDTVRGVDRGDDPDIIFVIVTILPAQIGVIRRIDIGSIVNGDTLAARTTHTLGPDFTDIWHNASELYCLRGTNILVVSPSTLTTIRTLPLSPAYAFRVLLGTNDLWVTDRSGGPSEGRVHLVDKATGTLLNTIDTRRYPMGGAIYGPYIYVYCLNNELPPPTPTGIGVFKYRISDGVELGSWINADDNGTFAGDDIVVWNRGSYLGVAWTGHKVFNMATDQYE